MAIRIEYQLTREETFSAIRASKRWIFVVIPVLGLILLAAVGFLALLEERITAEAALLGAYGTAILMFPELWLRWVVSRQKHLIGLPVEMTLDQDGITQKSKAADTRLGWTYFKSVRRAKGFWFLKLSPYQSIAIPARAFLPEQEQALEELLKEVGLPRS